MFGGNSPMPSPLGLAAGKMLSDGEQPRHMTEAHERAFRAMREALEGDKEEFETLLDGHVDDVSFAAVEQRLTAIRTALALAREVKVQDAG